MQVTHAAEVESGPAVHTHILRSCLSVQSVWPLHNCVYESAKLPQSEMQFITASARMLKAGIKEKRSRFSPYIIRMFWAINVMWLIALELQDNEHIPCVPICLLLHYIVVKNSMWISKFKIHSEAHISWTLYYPMRQRDRICKERWNNATDDVATVSMPSLATILRCDVKGSTKQIRHWWTM